MRTYVNSSCTAYSLDINGIWSGASRLASCRALSQCCKSLLICEGERETSKLFGTVPTQCQFSQKWYKDFLFKRWNLIFAKMVHHYSILSWWGWENPQGSKNWFRGEQKHLSYYHYGLWPTKTQYYPTKILFFSILFFLNWKIKLNQN